MTIIEAINKVDALKPNSYSQSEKVAWLSELDALIKREVIDTHVGRDSVEFEGYGLGTPLSTDLLIESPYEDVYIAWLESRIDYFNNETGKFNNSLTRFNNLYQGYSNDYNRHHRSISKHFRYF